MGKVLHIDCGLAPDRYVEVDESVPDYHDNEKLATNAFQAFVEECNGPVSVLTEDTNTVLFHRDFIPF